MSEVETSQMVHQTTALVPYDAEGQAAQTMQALAAAEPMPTELDEEKINPQELGQLIVKL